ncbi:MAG: N-acetyltransferase family protein [Dehalococcoidia bacterium]
MPGLDIVPAAREHNDSIREIYNIEVRRSHATLDIEPRTVMEQGQWLAEHDERCPVFVGLLNGVVIGYGALSQYQRTSGYRFAIEDSVYVHQAERGRGFGRLLLERLLHSATNLGYHTVLARLVAGHDPAVGLHESFGYRQVSHEREVAFKFDRWLDVVTMQLILPARPASRPQSIKQWETAESTAPTETPVQLPAN